MTKHISNHFTIETEQEDDGRWIAEILEILGALVYGNSQQQAIANAPVCQHHRLLLTNWSIENNKRLR